MQRKQCKECMYFDKKDGFPYCPRHMRWLAKRVEGELVPDPDSMQFIRYYKDDKPVYCDFQPIVNMEKARNEVEECKE